NQLCLVVNGCFWHSSEVDVAQLIIRYPERFQPLFDLFTAEDVAIFDRKNTTQQCAIRNSRVVLECDLAHAVPKTLSYVNVNGDELNRWTAAYDPRLTCNFHVEIPAILPCGPYSLNHFICDWIKVCDCITRIF